MPELGPNGVTQDYYNHIFQLRVITEWNNGTIEQVHAHIKNHPVPLYTEAYPEAVYGNVVNSYNKRYVERLNEIACELNELGKTGSLSLERLKELDSEVAKILYASDGK